MSFHIIRRFILALYLAALCLGIALFLVLFNPSVQRYGLSRVSKAIGCEVNTGKIRLSLGWKPGIHVQDIQVNTNQGELLLSASGLTLTPNLPDLLFSERETGLSGSVEAKNLKFHLSGSGEIKDYDLPRVVFNGNYNPNQRRVGISSLEIIVAGTSLSVRGQVRLPLQAQPDMDLTVTSPFMTIDTFKSLLPLPLFADWIRRELAVTVADGDIRLDALRLKGGLNQIQALNNPENAAVLSLKLAFRNLVIRRFEAPEFRDVSCFLSLEKGRLALESLSGRFDGSVFQNSTLVIQNMYADPIRYRVVADAGLSLPDLRHLEDLPFIPEDARKQIQGIQMIDGGADIRIAFDLESGQLIPESSAISIHDLKLIHPALRLPVEHGNATITSSAHEPFQFTGKCLWGKSDFQFEGSVNNDWKQLSARVITRADVTELLKIRLPQAGIGTWIYGSLDAEALLDDHGLTLDPARIDVGKGYLRFKGRRNFRPAPAMHWISHIHILQEPAQNLIQLIHPGAGLIDGSVWLEGVLVLKDPDGTGAFSGLNGHARLVIEKGWIHRNSPILNALAMISLERILKPDSPGFREGQLYFDRIEADIEIEKGKILIQNLTMQSPAINAAGAGTIDLNRDHLQLRIGLQPLGTVDSLVSGIPVIGNILTGKEKSLVVYSLEVTGSLSNPQIKNVPFKNIGESALGYVERMVFTPERILKSLTSLKDSPGPSLPDFRAEFDRMAPGS